MAESKPDCSPSIRNQHGKLMYVLGNGAMLHYDFDRNRG